MLRVHPHASPIGINPFDIDFSGMSQAQKGSAITGVADLFVGLFATGSSELSDKMRTLFDQVVRLFLIGIPAVQKRTATMHDLDDLMDSRAILSAASMASKAADYLRAFSEEKREEAA